MVTVERREREERREEREPERTNKREEKKRRFGQSVGGASFLFCLQSVTSDVIPCDHHLS